jgi:hypothetical protein
MLRNTLKRQARDDFLRRMENAARTVDEFQDIVDMYDKLDANRERRERYHEIGMSEYNIQYSGSGLVFAEIESSEFASDTAQEDLRDDGLSHMQSKKENGDAPSEADSDETDDDDTNNEGTHEEKQKKRYQKKESSKNYSYTDGAVIPSPIRHPYWRELMRGDFISYIFDNALEVWQIFDDWQMGILYRDKLTAKQKESLFLSAVRLATTEQIAYYTEKSDRAVRKLIAAALENIRKPLAAMIQKQLDDELPVAPGRRSFLEWYERQRQEKEQKETPGEKPGGEQAGG